MVSQQKRNTAMDIIRCAALFFVISVHFFSYSDFYDLTIQGPFLFLLTLCRSGFMICVPLFIVLSGYLMRNRTPCRKYYTKIVKTLSIYLLASICCTAFNLLYFGHSFYLPNILIEVTTFSAAPYSWYVEMYIGLFLLIPYLNILYNNIPTQAHKKLLLFILIFLTSLPSIVNIHNFLDFSWWLMPSVSNHYHKLLPDWWTNIYPITYYFLGCYLNEYPVKLRKAAVLCLYLLTFILNGAFNYYRSYQSTFIWGDWQLWESLPILIQTVLFFSLFTQMDCQHFGDRTRKILAKLSDWCFGAYLVSWIFDQLFYDILNRIQPVIQHRFYYFPLIVPAVFIASLLLSAILNKIHAIAAGIFASKAA